MPVSFCVLKSTQKANGHRLTGTTVLNYLAHLLGTLTGTITGTVKWAPRFSLNWAPHPSTKQHTKVRCLLCENVRYHRRPCTMCAATAIRAKCVLPPRGDMYALKPFRCAAAAEFALSSRLVVVAVVVAALPKNKKKHRLPWETKV